MARNGSGTTSPPRPLTGGSREGHGLVNGATQQPPPQQPMSTSPLYDPTGMAGGGVQQVMVPLMYGYPGMPPGGLMSFYGGVRATPFP